MKLTVLIDNNTLTDRYFIGEPGISFFIESEGFKLLFDAGYSDAFIQNAIKLDLDLLDIDYIVLSHGHLDHTWGLEPLVRKYMESKLEGKVIKNPQLIAHPFVFQPKYVDQFSIGTNLSEEFIKSIFSLKLSKEPIWLTDKLVFLGEIPREFKFEGNHPIGVRKLADLEVDDYLLDDSALVFISTAGLVIITGCSHAGICNIVEQAKKVTGIDAVSEIIGGFHLLSPNVEQLEKTKEYISNLNLRGLYPCHCTDLQSKIELAKVAEVREVGVGLELELN
ncbi:7,8-dihydropterin-6-yl-methyl-4-(beta-D-ribofuranosyl)aminobenzene 5'-phosphate synthase [Orenia metallireducens]|uniref:7,8-dihydropterin-6-yl-methyl-4-(Beta-D-ribofuranosyl)aminobenzene 5'-phosphate synthase n=1 Tax=Orenia metallireducens TaxID=1413210 RepID=A0A285HA75_9FIRM|nr:MBL fold metallo-hydrolase [Orenia metallireducens]PRX28909.1 7,8-dihydropterin-6-yl-methyl-4-(beta-D-ribofuranosyl)aminobenzene 5'-phosphate synthase [Orenia metallireducens]SNY32473.1 7,8-dihydropterin-6-yl-methyl-4-(beta-D-ribofuranosyl)aminobenzene 5'-phosphate synthase [Orenia metallireducens]